MEERHHGSLGIGGAILYALMTPFIALSKLKDTIKDAVKSKTKD